MPATSSAPEEVPTGIVVEFEERALHTHTIQCECFQKELLEGSAFVILT